ncbi:MAG TPA: beta-L-arabinofuranosidase domain-containing protein, partial [Bryobacteraceae bacterium]|nr:beta-L-arabinofuranosidase domain-containing protein [Bryobacteraceae bacterium]
KGAKPLAEMNSPRVASWEHPNDNTRATELRGHFTGHSLSALAHMAANGDADAKAKGDYMVAELAKVQEKLGGGYLSAFPMELFDRLDALSGKPRDANAPRDTSGKGLPWAPFYTVHKIFAGMIDQYQLAGNQQALKVARGMGDWADAWTASKTPEHMQQILEDEYGGMAESLYNRAALTNNPKYATAGDRFTKKWFFNMMGMHNDSLHRDPHGRPMHVNTHIPQVIGAARRYEISGDQRFEDVAEFFWTSVTQDRSFVTTGTSNGESWNKEPKRIAADLRETNTSATEECCCSYNMLKLTRRLYSWNPNPRYFDYYERSLLNMRIGTIHPETGYTQYYLSLVPGAYKSFNSEDNSFWCCTGTGVEEYSKLNDSIYWKDSEGIFVNLFIPSELNWKEKGFRLKQDTQFPQQQSTTFTVTADKPAQMSIRLRIPSWLKTGPAVKINGRALEATAAPGSYLDIKRDWKTGDKIEMELPMHLTVEATPDDPTLQAFLFGPLVLAGDFGAEGLTKDMIIGQSAPRIRWPRPNAAEAPAEYQNPNAPRRAPLPAVDFALKAGGADPNAWIKPAGKPLTFTVQGQSRNITLMPVNSVFDQRYVVYWQVG